jgi:sigma-B regulation protein RsbU (phosphoserine phosphatase)
MPIVEQTGQPVFASAFYGVIDTAARSLTYGNAGHPAPLVRHSHTDIVSRLSPLDPEPAAGLIADFAYTCHVCDFQRGDLLLGYTDGILEASDIAGTMFGEERLREILTASPELPGAEVCDRILHEVKNHSGRSEFEDDVCIVAIESR